MDRLCVTTVFNITGDLFVKGCVESPDGRPLKFDHALGRSDLL
jgi:hypothetical protein